MTRQGLFAVLALFLALGLSSCDNLSGSDPQNVPAQNTYAPNYNDGNLVIVRGSVGVSGALPKSVFASLAAKSDVARSAQPSLNMTEYYYYVAAIPQDDIGNVPIEYGKNDADKFVPGETGICYEIGLAPGKWKIECGIKNSADKPVLRDISDTITLTLDNGIVSQNFIAAPVKDAGDGSVSLKIFISAEDHATDVKKITASSYADAWGAMRELEATTSYFELDIDSIAPAAYDVIFNFYNESGVMVYQTIQTVNVLSGMKTDVWNSSGGLDDDVINNETGNFFINSDIVATFKRSVLYVGDTRSFAPNAKAPDNANDGGAYTPFATLQAAVDSIAALGKEDGDYKIFVCGTVEGNTKLEENLGGHARSITIAGMDGAEQAVLAGGGPSGEHNVLGVETYVPIKIRGVKITKLASADYSRGVSINDSEACVTLLDGTEISGHIVPPEFGGAGVNVQCGALCMKGGVIKQNAADFGGAVRCAGTFEISGSASIPCAEGERNEVYLDDGSSIKVCGALTQSGTVATISTDWSAARGQVGVEAAGSVSRLDAYKPLFALGNGEFRLALAAGNTELKFMAPVFVSAASSAEDPDGTSAKPYKTMAEALARLPDTPGVEAEIGVIGSVGNCELTTENLTASKCSALTLSGYNKLASGDGQDKIDAGGSGTALAVSSTVPVIIENLKITGGSNTSGDGKGGGIYVAGGADVTLKAGAVVAGNTAKKGGGVYVDGSFTLDGGTIGDASKTEHATRLEYSNNATDTYSFGGGIFFSNTGKVNIKSGVIAYNFAFRGGGIASEYTAYSSDSQLTIEGGEIRHNCSYSENGNLGNNSFGGGVFVNGSKFSFTGGEIYENYGCDGAGGLFLQNASVASMSGGSIHDNAYTDGLGCMKRATDLLLWDNAVLNMSGGKIYSTSRKERGVIIWNATDSLSMSGSAFISQNTPVLLGSTGDSGPVYTQITIAGALTPPDPDDLSKKNAYIVPAEWTRGLQVLNAPDSIPAAEQAALVAANIGRFATTDEDFDVKAKDAAGFISAPFCVAASDDTRKSPDSDGKEWSAPDSTEADQRGTRAHPYAKMSQAVAQMTDNTVPYEILVNGTIKGADYACATFEGANVGDVTIRGVNGDNSIDALDVDKLDAGNTSKSIALKFIGAAAASKMSATIQNLKITGANNLGGGDSYPHGGGIYAHYANISLGKGVLITGNKAYYGGGVYLDGSNLFVYANACIGQDASGTATDESDCSNYARSDGGGIYCNQSNAYLGYKEDLSVAAGDDAWTGGIYRNCSSYNGGGIRIGNGSEIKIAAGNISRNLATKEGGGIYIHSNGTNSAVISGGKIEENQSKATGTYDGGGGICNLGSLVVKDDAEILGNKANKGGGVCNGSSSGSLSVLGGKIHDNTADASGGAVYQVAGTFSMGGTAYIPYGGAEKKNDVYLESDDYITIESALSLPTGASGPNATITPAGWKRGTVIAQGKDGGTLSDDVKYWLALAAAEDSYGESDVWEIYRSSDNKEAKINAPIYVSPATLSPPGSDDNIGTHSAPYLTVTHALDDLNDPSQDYTIYIYGTIIDHVTINKSKTTDAKSLTLESGNFDLIGPGSALSGGCDASEPWDSTAIGRTLWVKGNVPVTIRGLIITGGKENANGGGILVDEGAELTLDEYCLVTGNYATGFGAGIFVNDGGTLNIKGCIRVKDNKTVDYSDSSVQSDSNVYLPNGNVIKVMGSLTWRIPGASSDPGNSEIWVSTEDQPSISGSGASATVTTVPITSGYKENNTNNGAVVSPGVYFKGDKYGVALVGNEAALGVHGGSISIDPMHDDVTFSADKTWINRDAGADKVTFTAKDGLTSIAFGDGDGKMKLSPSVSYHGEDVPQSGYWSFSSSGTSASLTFGSSLPAGKYVAALTGEYKGKTYSASYQIEISSTEKNISGTVTSANPSCSSVFNGRTLNIPSLIASDHEVTQEEYSKYAGFNSSPSDTYGVGDNYPAYNVSWYDALVYCNMRSMAERLEPVYVINGETDPTKWPGVSVKSGKYYGPTGPLNSNSNYAIWDAATMVGNTASVITTANGWRLPTEVEWEYLARGGNLTDTGQFEFSGSDDASEVAWWGGANDGNARGKLHEVRQKKPNAFGLYDMSGNVGEFVWDWPTNISAETPIAGETPASPGTDRRFKGGYYLLTTENNNYLKISYRTSCTKSFRGDYAGFRVVRTVR